MRRSWSASGAGGGTLLALAALAAAAAAQTPGLRVAYHVRIVSGDGPAASVIAEGEVTGPADTRLRLAVRTDTAVVEALLGLLPEDDTVTVSGDFFTRRRLGRSRRGLPLWEEDSYERSARLPWGDTARVLLFGRRSALRLELVATRAPAGGVTRPSETVTLESEGLDLSLEAVLRPRRVVAILSLVQGDLTTVPRSYDFVLDAPSQSVVLPAAPGGTAQRTLEVELARPEPARGGGGRRGALELDDDVVCLRVLPATPGEPVRAVCGRLNNVARRLALPEGDTLVATFAWPTAR